MKLIKIAKKDKIASILLFNNKNKFLILKRSKNSKNNPSKWNLPGGHIDPGENPKEAAIRECEEEAGITPKNVKFLGVFGKVYIFIGESNKKPKINDESDDWVFINKKNINKYDFPKKYYSLDKIVEIAKKEYKKYFQ
jgi:mutator protein MutT